MIDNPRIEYLGAIGIVLFGLVFYVPFIHFKWELPYFGKLRDFLKKHTFSCISSFFFFYFVQFLKGYVTIFIQNLLEVALPDKDPEE